MHNIFPESTCDLTEGVRDVWPEISVFISVRLDVLDAILGTKNPPSQRSLVVTHSK